MPVPKHDFRILPRKSNFATEPSSVRIVVENVIAGVKRCRIVKDVSRLTKAGMSDMVMEIACGLHKPTVCPSNDFASMLLYQ